MRDLNATLIAPILKITGFRFDKSYRHAERGFKALVYRAVNVVAANLKAGI